MLIEDIYSVLMDFLNDNIDDPHPTRTEKWIYPQRPRQDTTMPRISITHASTSRVEIGVGDIGSRVDAVFEIGIWCDSRFTITVDETDIKGNRLMEYIGDKVMDLFINKRKFLKDEYGFLDALIVGTSLTPYNPGTDLYHKSIFVDLQWDAEVA